ncbi:hypothetical protein N1851_017357 [Merluccius polli]|uniref:Uncharacterized protein n=1 Tax=Merluccius polli TaxID=89951 RepID=A0AA47NZ43_MERPO|nr:hypothetical protein N1851_017357 [Merluccius polli]
MRHRGHASCPETIRAETSDSLAYISYSRQELLIIGSCNPVNFIDDLGITVEISKLAGQTTLAPPPRHTERWRQQKRIHRGCRGGLRDRLRLAPHKTALPSIFLANV